MDNFDALENIDEFCKVLIKKAKDKPENVEAKHPDEKIFEKLSINIPYDPATEINQNVKPEIEEPLVDVFDEGDQVRILVQCRCREQQVTFHPSSDGIIVCREECYRERDGSESCSDVCRKLNIKTDELQLEDMLFVVAKCNNNNTLEAMIPKIKK
ncbi:MAG: hypothetical protein NWE98_11495 [Candidatus Bathyarchaeota archaeon]|nr:hypothetical protein [Candidatus Bathyarchaeota archaeon]